jgi:hypothetical protein
VVRPIVVAARLPVEVGDTATVVMVVGIDRTDSTVQSSRVGIILPSCRMLGEGYWNPVSGLVCLVHGVSESLFVFYQCVSVFSVFIHFDFFSCMTAGVFFGGVA